MTGFTLPRQAVIEGKTYAIHTDFRDILEIFSYLEDPDLPEYIRWQVALGLFYEDPLEEEHFLQGARYFTWFVNGGKEDTQPPGPKLLDWEQDAQLIVADVNKVAGREIRELRHIHWWTFLSWFHGIGEGQLATVIAIRQKRQEGKKLDDWEADFYRRNRAAVDLPQRLSREEQDEKKRLLEMLMDNDCAGVQGLAPFYEGM